MFESESLDALLARLESWQPARPNLSRARVESSIAATEMLVARLRLAPDTCMYRSMGRYAILRANGVRVTFRMGVRPPPFRTGHAWIEDENGPYREEIADGDYVVTVVHPERV